MHFHADHALFFARRPSQRRAAVSILVAVAALIANAGAGSPVVSLSGATVAAVGLLWSFRQDRHRLEPALAWGLSIVVVTLLAGFGLGADARPLAEAGARTLCGVLWVLWLGTRVDWASLRALLLRLRVPEGIVATLDHALLHGLLTQREWGRRRDAARLRLGRPQLPVATWGALLGEGALSALSRLEQVEETGMLRSAAVQKRATAGTTVMSVPGGPVVELSGVQVNRGGAAVLRDLRLALGQGEWLAVCGPSGSGKSTLLRLLAGLDLPAQGQVQRLGRPIREGTPWRERLDGRIGLLVQNPEHHFIASTVAEDIAWGLLRRDCSAREAAARARVAADALGVGHLLERPCHALSFGEQRRVALAGLLVLEPQLLLLDEPTAGLDPLAAHALAREVRAVVASTQAACVWATHDWACLPPEVSRVVLLSGEGVVFDGPVSQGLSPHWLARAGLALPAEEVTAC